jgi:hypothetical protein
VSIVLLCSTSGSCPRSSLTGLTIGSLGVYNRHALYDWYLYVRPLKAFPRPPASWKGPEGCGTRAGRTNCERAWFPPNSFKNKATYKYIGLPALFGGRASNESRVSPAGWGRANVPARYPSRAGPPLGWLYAYRLDLFFGCGSD